MVVTIANLKGGCGKTTTAMALAFAAVKESKNALVLDADPQASSTQWAIEAESKGGMPFDVDSVNNANMSKKASFASGDPYNWVFIDCPPSGDVIDRAADIADIVVIPSGTGVADISKAMTVVSTLQASNKLHAVLITQARAHTVSLAETFKELEENCVSYFETVIPLREDLRAYYGNVFGNDLYGYSELLREIEEVFS